MEENEFIRIHSNVMAAIQHEWEKNTTFHKKRHKQFEGIRSSQISALVAVLLKVLPEFLEVGK